MSYISIDCHFKLCRTRVYSCYLSTGCSVLSPPFNYVKPTYLALPVRSMGQIYCHASHARGQLMTPKQSPTTFGFGKIAPKCKAGRPTLSYVKENTQFLCAELEFSIFPWPVSRECIPQEPGRIEYHNQ